jgi:hypothetical protein
MEKSLAVPPRRRDGAEKSYFVDADAGQLPRYSARLFLPACFWPARIADQSAVRAGGREAAKNGGTEKVYLRANSACNERSWTW